MPSPLPPAGLRVTALALAAAIAACASVPPPPAPVGGRCNASAVAWAIGKPWNEEVMNRVWRESGAGLIRPINPNQAVRREQREDRVNVVLDGNNNIAEIFCG